MTIIYIFLLIERGLAHNTIISYREDLHQFASYLAKHHLSSFVEVDQYQILDFLTWEQQQGKARNSIIRLISTLRKFFQYLIRMKVINNNPMTKIKPPKQGLHLPAVLSEREMNQILALPDLNKPLGIRDRAMLEVLYATGLRVSELVNLKLQDLHLEVQLIQTIGKGDKERLVPIDSVAQSWLNRYLAEVRPKLVKQANSFIFLNAHGGQLTRQALWQKKLKGMSNKLVSKKLLHHTLFAIVLQLIYWKMVLIYGQCKNCSDTQISQPPKFIRMSHMSILQKPISDFIPGHSLERGFINVI